MNIHSKEFWETVKTEYNPMIYPYICLSSDTFAKEWAYERLITKNRKIKKLAKQFLRYNFWRFKYWSVQTGKYVIFTNDGKEIRKEFIEWCIKRYTK